MAAVGSCLLLAFGAGGSGSGGLAIWPLFGSTNQILAGLTLLVMTVMLIKLGRPARYTMAPMIFVLVISFWAGAVKLIEFFETGDYLLVAIDAVVLNARSGFRHQPVWQNRVGSRGRQCLTERSE